MKIIAISDTHNNHDQLNIPAGDILIHAGNITRAGTLPEVSLFNEWLGSLTHKYKIVIAGNHDHCFQQQGNEASAILTNGIYLEDSEIVIDGVRIYGSPWQPRFHNWAFNLDRGAQIAEKWRMIPPEVDVLITHGPPFGHNDLTRDGHYVGCKELLDQVEQLKPQVHIFGLIPEDAGISFNADTAFINAAICDRWYRPVNKPQCYDLKF